MADADLNQRRELLKHAEFFIDAVAGYHADFVLFPEYMSAPLIGLFNDKNPPDAIRALAGFTSENPEWFTGNGHVLQHQYYCWFHA